MLRKGRHFAGLIFLILLSVAIRTGPTSGAELNDLSVLDCDGGIVSLGDTPYSVLKKYGEPADVEKTTYYVRSEVWVYDFGTTRLIYYLTFKGNRLHRIQSGGFGD